MDDDVMLKDSPDPVEVDESTEQGEVSTKRKLSHSEEPRKKIRAETLAEDKKRGKRLFGSLLGTLGGNRKEINSAKFQERTARQAELEQRQQQRQQELDDEIAKRQTEASESRKQRQREAEAAMKIERVKTFHAHQVILARNLLTKAEPPIYFRPWEMTKEQEQMVASQIRRAKEDQARARLPLQNSGNTETGEQVPDAMDTTTTGTIKGDEQSQEPLDMVTSEDPEQHNKLSSAADKHENMEIEPTAEPAAEGGILPPVEDSHMRDDVPTAQESTAIDVVAKDESGGSEDSKSHATEHVEHQEHESQDTQEKGLTTESRPQEKPENVQKNDSIVIQQDTLPMNKDKHQISRVSPQDATETIER